MAPTASPYVGQIVLGLLLATATAASPACIGSFTGLQQTVSASDRASALDVDIVQPKAIAVGPFGDVFFTDGSASYIRVLHPDGSVAVVAGTGSPGFSGDGGPALLAQVNHPTALLVLPNNNVVFGGTNRVRAIRASDAAVFTIAGGNGSSASGDGGAATLATLNGVFGLGVDGAGNIYISDTYHCRVRMIWASNATIATVAGSGALGWSGDGGPATAAALGYVWGIAVLSDGTFYVAAETAIRVIARGIIVSLFGSSAGAAPQISSIKGVAVDSAHNVYFSDYDTSSVWLFHHSDSIIQLFAGVGVAGYTGDGGPSTAAALSGPLGLAVSDSFLYITEFAGAAIRRVDLRDRTIARVAGSLVPAYGSVRPATSTSVMTASLAVGDSAIYSMSASGPTYVAALNTTTWQLSPIAGNGLDAYGGDGGAASLASLSAYAIDGSAGRTCFNFQSSMAVGEGGVVYIAETGSSRIRMLDPRRGSITTVIGNGGSNDGVMLPTLAAGGVGPTDAAIGAPSALVLDTMENIFFTYGGIVAPCTDVNIGTWGVAVWNVSTGRVGHVGCNATEGFGGDGGPATAAMCCKPMVTAVDSLGNVYFTEYCNHRVRVIFSNGTIATVAGNGTPGYSGDGGPATAATLNHPWVVRADASVPPRLFINDFTNGRIRFMWPNGTIGTLAGNGDVSGSIGDGGDATSVALGGIQDFAFDAAGNLLFSPYSAGQLRAVVLGDWINCPIGYSCPCATPVACSNPATYCPGNTLQPYPVADGFFSTPDGGLLRSGQAPCPRGFFCRNGTRSACFPGTFGTLPYRTSPSHCSVCPAGTYSARAAETSASACVPCPAGSYSATSGAALCTPCPLDTWSAATGNTSATTCHSCSGQHALLGSTECFSLSAGSVGVADVVVAVEVLPRFASSGIEVVALEVIIAAVVVVTVLIPLALVWLGHAWAHRVRHVAAVWCCASARWSMRRADLFALHHVVREGSSPVKQRTAFGGGMTLLTVATISAVGAALLVQFSLHNSLVQQSILPLSLSAVTRAVAHPPLSSLESSLSASNLPFYVSSGVGLQVRVTGAECAVVESWNASALLAGAFTLSSTPPSPSLETVHTFTSADCVFSALSTLTATFAPSCQSFFVQAVAMSSEGVLTLASVAIQGPSPRTSSADPVLSAIDVSVVPTLETYAGSASLRGHRVAIDSVTRHVAVAPPSVTLTFVLAQPPYFVSILVVPLQSTAQLLSSLVGLLGLFGLFAFAFGLAEEYVAAPARRGRRGCTASRWWRRRAVHNVVTSELSTVTLPTALASSALTVHRLSDEHALARGMVVRSQVERAWHTARVRDSRAVDEPPHDAGMDISARLVAAEAALVAMACRYDALRAETLASLVETRIRVAALEHDADGSSHRLPAADGQCGSVAQAPLPT